MMEKITSYVGRKIRLFRKHKGLTLMQLAQMINKSKSSVSKYESGEIAIDVETLLDLSNALDVNISCLIDYRNKKTPPESSGSNIFCDTDELYMYYWDGRVKRNVKSFITITRDPARQCPTSAMLYMDIPSFDQYDNCKYLYGGNVNFFDLVSHFYLINQTNTVERLTLQVFHPLHTSFHTWGILMGLSYMPFAPVAIKVLLSKEAISDENLKRYPLRFTTEDIRRIKHYNMLFADPKEPNSD